MIATGSERRIETAVTTETDTAIETAMIVTGTETATIGEAEMGDAAEEEAMGVGASAEEVSVEGDSVVDVDSLRRCKPSIDCLWRI